MREFCVRASLAGDLAGVVALERATAEAPHWAEAEYAAALEGGGDDDCHFRRCLFVAEAGDALIGFAVGKVMGDHAELESVAVDLRARREGIGRVLCEAVIDWCKGQRTAAIDLEVRAASEGAIALYRSLDFVVAGRRRGYYGGPPDDAVLMRLDLEEVQK